MKKLSIFALLVMAILLPLHNPAYAEDAMKAAAIKKLQTAVVAALPIETSMARIAVIDVGGDDGTLQSALTTALAGKTAYKVIERADLDKLLNEQGLQLKDIIDEKTRVEPGRLRGVQGLVIAKVLGMESGFMSYTIRMNVKLDDVEKGEIVFTKDLSVTAVSPARMYVTYAAAGLLVLIVFIVVRRSMRSRSIRTSMADGVKARVDLIAEVASAIRNISDAKASLMNRGKVDDAVALKGAERDAMLLKQQIENALRGNAATSQPAEFKGALEFDTYIIGTFKDLTVSADKLYAKVTSNGEFKAEVNELNKNIKDAANAYRGRRI